jgi:cell division protein FtsW
MMPRQLSLQPGGTHWSDCINWTLVALIMALSSIGLVMVTSASMSFAEVNYNDGWFYAKRYAVFWSLGFAGALLVAAVPASIWENYGSLFLIVALMLLTLVLIPGLGRKVNGSQRWLQIGPLALQASEMVKFCVIVFYASYLARRGQEVLRHWSGVLKPLVILIGMIALLLLEPDFGATVVLTGTVMAMLFVAGLRLFHFLWLLVGGAACLAGLALLSPYRVQRLVTYQDPWADQFNSGYQLTQSLIAFGRGEWFGLGLGNSVQKLFYLPEAHTDFIFAIIAEEFGLVGVALVVLVFLALVVSVLDISRRAMMRGKLFASFATFGTGVMFAGQAFINVGVASGLLPTKGLTMPFISYGGSSLLVSCALMALVLRIDWELRREELAAPETAKQKKSKSANVKQKAKGQENKKAPVKDKPVEVPVLTQVIEQRPAEEVMA